MEKIIFYILIGTFLIQGVYGLIPIGTNISQENLDSVGIGGILNADLECQDHGYTITYNLWTPKEVRYDLSCLDIIPLEDHNGLVEGWYTVIRPHFYKSLKFNRMWEIYRATNTSYTINWMTWQVQNELISQKESIRHGMIEQLSPPFEVEAFNYTIDIDLLLG